MIKMNCDNCGGRIGAIIDTDMFICSACLQGKTEAEIEMMIGDIRALSVPRHNDLEIQM